MALAFTRKIKSERSRTLILAAATHLLAQKGFGAVTLQEILDAAEVTKGRFFHYFSSKEDLFETVLREAVNQREFLKFRDLVKAMPRKSSAVSKLTHLIDQIIGWQKDGLPESMRLCVFATFFFSRTAPEIRQVANLLTDNQRVLEQLIKKAQREGSLPNSIHPAVFSLLFASVSVGGNIIGFLHDRKKLSIENLEELKTIIHCFQHSKKTATPLEIIG